MTLHKNVTSDARQFEATYLIISEMLTGRIDWGLCKALVSRILNCFLRKGLRYNNVSVVMIVETPTVERHAINSEQSGKKSERDQHRVNPRSDSPTSRKATDG